MDSSLSAFLLGLTLAKYDTCFAASCAGILKNYNYDCLPSTNAVIKLFLLGKFQLTIRGKDATALLSYDKVKLLLAILCLDPNRSFSRTHLAEMLWPDVTLEKGRARLRHALHTLRQVFKDEPDVLAPIKSPGVSLESKHFCVDVLGLLDGANQAPTIDVAMPTMYSGRFLDGLKLPEGETFTTWYMGWQARCQTELYDYRLGVCNHYLEQQQQDTALRFAKMWVQQQPEEEGYHRLVIRLLMECGDKQAALQAYKHCCVMLDETQGAQPSHETFALLGITSVETLTPVFSNDSSVQNASYRPFATVAVAIEWAPAVTYDIRLHSVDDFEPEEALEAIQYWQNQVRNLASQHGAWLSDTGGSTVLAHFGYPTFTEWPVGRAVALAQAIAQLLTQNSVKIGLAIHADSTLIIESFTLNLNGLLYQSIVPLAWEAKHGQILLSPEAAARMSEWKIKGLGDSHKRRYQLDTSSRHGQQHHIRGRLHEFDRLTELWTDHQASSPLFFNLFGLPGLGKSQLAQALGKFVMHTGGRVILFDSVVQDKTPFKAFDNWLYSQLESPEQFSSSKETLEKELHELKVAKSASEGSQLSNVDYIVDRALMLMYQYQDSSLPLLVVWKGLDDADVISIKFLQALLYRKTNIKVMVLGLSCQPLATVESDASFHLQPLGLEEQKTLLDYRARGMKIPAEVKNEILEQSAGNPLYIEEAIHLYQLGLPIYHIPRVADSISNQLYYVDGLTRNLACLIALLGKLTIKMAVDLLAVTNHRVQTSLAKLIGLGLIQQGDTSYFVSSDMIKFAIQRTMTRHDRQSLYTKVAEYFIQSNQPAEMIAKQLQQARSAQAGQWWRQAITDAMQQGSTKKAAIYVTEALISYQYIQDVQLRKRYELEGYFTLGSLQVSHSGPVSPQAIEAYDKAADLDINSDGADQLAVIWGRWVVMHGSGDLLEALQLAKQMKKLALMQRQVTWYGWSLYAEAQYHFWTGNPSLAESLLLEAANALLQVMMPPPEHSPLANHSDALAFSALGLAQSVQGRQDAAMQNISVAIKRAEQSNSLVSLAICHIQQLRIYYVADQLPLLYRYSQGVLEKLKKGAPDSIWCAIVGAYVQMCKVLLEPIGSDKAQALSLLIPVIEQGLPLGKDAFLCLVARSYIALGDTEKAVQLLDQALLLSQERNSALILPEIYCLYGDVWIKRQRLDLAQEQWHKARGVARKNQLLCYEAWVAKRFQELVVKTES